MISRGAWLVLQLNRVVIESGLLIVESDVAILVKLRSGLATGGLT